MSLLGDIAQEIIEINWYWWLLLLATAIITILIRKEIIRTSNSILNKSAVVLFTPYCVMILLLTLLNRNLSQGQIIQDQWMPFESYRILFSGYGYAGLMNQIIMNYFLFIPFGLFFYCAFDCRNRVIKSVVYALAFSFMIETIQLFFGIGLFEFDDLLGNTIGSFVGAIIGRGLTKCGVNNNRRWRSRQSCKRD